MLSSKLLKIADIIEDPLQRVSEYKYFIVLTNKYIYIIIGINKSKCKNNQIYHKLQIVKKELEKQSQYIETKLNFVFDKSQQPIDKKDTIYIYGKYNYNFFSDDQAKKTIAQWKNFGYKFNQKEQQNSTIKTTQNSVY